MHLIVFFSSLDRPKYTHCCFIFSQQIDEARSLPLHPLSTHLARVPPSSSTTTTSSSQLLTNQPATTSNADTSLNGAGWDLQQLLLAFPELAGALKVALGASATTSNSSSNNSSSSNSSNSTAFEEKTDPFVGGRAGSRAGASLLATNVPLPPSLHQSQQKRKGEEKSTAKVKTSTKQRVAAAGLVVDGTVKATVKRRHGNRPQHKSGGEDSSCSDDDFYEIDEDVANAEGEERESATQASNNGNGIDWGSSSDDDNDKEEVKRREPRTSKSYDEDDENHEEAENAIAALKKQEGDKIPFDEATPTATIEEQSPVSSPASPTLKLPPTVRIRLSFHQKRAQFTQF